jgi:ABC-type Fe3+/spermidine/putrescine transport system ATPase subunit
LGQGNIVLECRQITKRFGSVVAVEDVNFEIHKGETLALLGPSGCGKSTILRIVAGLEIPDSAEITLSGTVVTSTAKGIHVLSEKRNVGLVFQSYAVWPHLTVKQNIAFPLTTRRLRDHDIERKVNEIVAVVGLAGFEARLPTQLSGGQQQRVAIARSLVYSPELLLLDEPFSNLDAKLRRQMRIELKRLLQRVGIAVLFVTHDQVEAMSISDRMVIMNAGRIEQVGTPYNIYANSATRFVQDFIGSTVTFQGRAKQDGTTVFIELAEGAYLQLPRNHIPPAKKVYVTVRPEDITPDPSRRDCRPNEIKALVEDVLFLGGRREYVLQAAGTEIVMESSHLGAKAGDDIILKINPERVKVWS